LEVAQLPRQLSVLLLQLRCVTVQLLLTLHGGCLDGLDLGPRDTGHKMRGVARQVALSQARVLKMHIKCELHSELDMSVGLLEPIALIAAPARAG
jgi:hypothetical protein